MLKWFIHVLTHGPWWYWSTVPMYVHVPTHGPWWYKNLHIPTYTYMYLLVDSGYTEALYLHVLARIQIYLQIPTHGLLCEKMIASIIHYIQYIITSSNNVIIKRQHALPLQIYPILSPAIFHVREWPSPPSMLTLCDWWWFPNQSWAHLCWHVFAQT